MNKNLSVATKYQETKLKNPIIEPRVNRPSPDLGLTKSAKVNVIVEEKC